MFEQQKKHTIQVHWSIRWKLMLGMAVLIVTLTLILTTLQISSQKALLEGELEKRIALMRENLVERGKSFIITLDKQVENDIAAFNFSGLLKNVEDSVQTVEEIKYVVLLDASGTVFIHTEHPELVQTQLNLADPRIRFALRQTGVIEKEWTEKGRKIIEIDSPIQISMQRWGALRLVFSLDRLEAEITRSEAQIETQTRGMIYRSIFSAFGFLVISFFLVFALSTQLSKPLTHLTQAARTLSKGNFELSEELRITSRDEIGVLGQSFVQMSRDLKFSYDKLEEYSRTLEQKVEERTEELQASLLEVGTANRKIMQSIQYAKLIQHALLPSREIRHRYLPNSFFLWMPRDVVGGDMFFMEALENGSFILAVIDCTGHGVPGAFMTMIASSSLTRIIRDDGCTDPGEILAQLNKIIQGLFHQNHGSALSDNGLDAAVCTVNSAEKRLIFAGARMPLFIRCQDCIKVIKGDRESVGYQRSETEYQYSSHSISLCRDMSFYLATDGYIDQLSSSGKMRLGTRRFKQLLREQEGRLFPIQQELLLKAFHRHKGSHEQQDDVTVVGFNLEHLLKEQQ